MPPQADLGRPHSTGLVEVLDRVLDKGLFVGGDVTISLAEVELLTIRIRLIVCSLDKAREMGLDWWTYDRHLSPGRVAVGDDRLERRVQDLEAQLAGHIVAARASEKPARPRRTKQSRAKRTG
jgi:hypothetical protein